MKTFKCYKCSSEDDYEPCQLSVPNGSDNPMKCPFGAYKPNWREVSDEQQ